MTAVNLSGKSGAVFAATGAVAGAVALELAACGARVHLSGRDGAATQAVADRISAAGGFATAAVVDALDDVAVNRALDKIIESDGKLDFVFNGIGMRCAEGRYALPAAQVGLADFMRPIEVIAGSQYLTSRAAALRMAGQGSGSIVTLSASLNGIILPFMVNITAACAAIEAMTRGFAAEFGSVGVRVNCVRAAGMPDTRTIIETSQQMAMTMSMAEHHPSSGSGKAALGRPVTTAETAAMVAWLVSDGASGITAQICNVCGGELI